MPACALLLTKRFYNNSKKANKMKHFLAFAIKEKNQTEIKKRS
jgi:hypothetical protein